MKKNIRSILLSAAIIAGGLDADAPTAPKIGAITYVGFDGAPLNLTEQVAIDRGFFGARGLDVKFVGAANGGQMASSLIGGSAQIGTLTISATAPLLKQGQCFQYLTAGARTYYNLVAQPDLKLPNANQPYPKNLVDLKGKKIAINARGTAMEFMMDAVLRQAGPSPADITYIATGGAATAVAAFRNKQVDVALDFPIQEQLLKPGDFQYMAKLTEISANNPIYHLTQVFSGASCDYVKKNPQVGRGVLLRSWRRLPLYQQSGEPGCSSGRRTEDVEYRQADRRELLAAVRPVFAHGKDRYGVLERAEDPASCQFRAAELQRVHIIGLPGQDLISRCA